MTGTAAIGTIAQPGAWLDSLLARLEGNEDPYFTSYVAYLVEGYRQVYGSSIYTTPASAYRRPYATSVPAPAGFNGEKTYNEVLAIMAPSPAALFKPATLASIQPGADSAFRRRLAGNEVDDWCPVTPVRLWIHRADEEVDPALQFAAYDHLSCGSDVSLETSDEAFPLPHLDYWHHSLPAIRAWALSLS